MSLAWYQLFLTMLGVAITIGGVLLISHRSKLLVEEEIIEVVTEDTPLIIFLYCIDVCNHKNTFYLSLSKRISLRSDISGYSPVFLIGFHTKSEKLSSTNSHFLSTGQPELN